MNTQTIRAVASRPRRRRPADASRRPHRAPRLGRRRLEVLHGRVWLTRAGDLDDHVVEAGQSRRRSPPLGARARRRPRTTTSRRSSPGARRASSIASARAGRRARPLLGHRRSGAADRRRRRRRGDRAGRRARCCSARSPTRARARCSAPPVLHNSAGTRAQHRPRPGPRTGTADDVSADPRDRARLAAQEARRRPAGPA